MSFSFEKIRLDSFIFLIIFYNNSQCDITIPVCKAPGAGLTSPNPATSGSYGGTNNQSTPGNCVIPIAASMFNGINFHGLLPGENKTTVGGDNGYGLVTTGGEYPAFDYIIESGEASQLIKQLNSMVMDFRASLSLLHASFKSSKNTIIIDMHVLYIFELVLCQTVGYISDYEYTLPTTSQGDLIASLCSKISDFNRLRSKPSNPSTASNSSSSSQFQCLVQWPPEIGANSHLQVPCLIITGTVRFLQTVILQLIKFDFQN